MGLDITAYRNLKKVENPKLDEDGYPLNWETEWKPGASMEWSEKHFSGRGEGINHNSVYSFVKEDTFDFRAGSYSGYNWWRSKLEEFAEGDLFQELINFADNEGVIGPVVSKKLFQDFKNNEERSIQFSLEIGEDGEYWLHKYKDWQKAFEFASENGAVDFH